MLVRPMARHLPGLASIAGAGWCLRRYHSSAVDTSESVKALMAGWSMEVTPQAADKVKGPFHEFLARGTAVNVTFLPGSDIEETVAVCERLRREGMHPVPHIAARSIRNLPHLEEYLARLRDRASVTEVLVIGGGVATPCGSFDNSLQIAESGLLQTYGITRVGFGAHPEGSPDISHHRLVEAMRAKNDWARAHDDSVEVYLETQFCFDAATVIEWDKQMAKDGNVLPLHIGVAGPAKLMTLIRFAKMSGVGASLRMLTKQPAAVLQAMALETPAQFVTDLASCVQEAGKTSNIRRLHFYSFGGAQRTGEWATKAADTGLTDVLGP